MIRLILTVLMITVVLLLGSCATPPDRQSIGRTGPYLMVLGTAQDGGMPQIGGRADNDAKRLVSALLIADPRSGRRWLVDATPDIREQVELARGHPPTRRSHASRPPLFEGIFITHAHMGHYTGLVHLGREAQGAKETPVYASEGMATFLETNGPWDLLVKLKNIVIRRMQPGRAVTLAPGLELEPFTVPHRGEYTDTFGFIIRGPERSVLYIPDIDRWEQWDRRIEKQIAGVDVALLDGTFFSGGELPGRDMSKIPHPLIEESMRRFRNLPDQERAKVHFTHLNHTNPAARSGSEARRSIERAGFNVAEDGLIFDL